MTVSELQDYLKYIPEDCEIKIVIQGYEQFTVDTVVFDLDNDRMLIVSNQPAEPYNET